jgi:hypothetical protein
LRDVEGRLVVHRSQLRAHQQRIDLFRAAGVYAVRVTDAEGRSSSTRLVRY